MQWHLRHSYKNIFSIKSIICYLQIFSLLCIVENTKAQKTYILISKKTEKLNPSVVAALPPYLKALAAFYSALGGTNCRDQECALTTALGLGKQGSDAQKSMIQKYFPDDKVARLVIGQDCYLPPNSSTSFSNFSSLNFVTNGADVRVNYVLDVFEQGNMKVINGPDIYLFKGQIFKNTKRVLYAWADK
jgi:hypothetical protein